MKILVALASFLLFYSTGISQDYTFKSKLSKIPDIEVTPISNSNFNEFYEVSILQPVDHLKPSGDKFRQRFYVGFKGINLPVVFETDGYALASTYSNELATELNANVVAVEHRFFGKSVPDSLRWDALTVKQAADDYHVIKNLLDTLFTGKWVSTGISKGGQAALGYKLFYPKDVAATVVYGTAIKNKQTVYTDSLLYNLAHSECGNLLNGLQLFAFQHKGQLLSILNTYNYKFAPLDLETALDYILLELPFSFWQNGNSCDKLPGANDSMALIADYIFKVVPPRFFSSTFRPRVESAFYMFYHELGYYEYSVQPLKAWLKQRSYSNLFFAPPNQHIEFDSSYQQSIIAFLKTAEADNIFFIYGEHDPWFLQTIVNKNVFTVEAGSHRSRIAGLTKMQKANLLSKIMASLN